MRILKTNVATVSEHLKYCLWKVWIRIIYLFIFWISYWSVCDLNMGIWSEVKYCLQLSKTMTGKAWKNILKEFNFRFIVSVHIRHLISLFEFLNPRGSEKKRIYLLFLGELKDEPNCIQAEVLYSVLLLLYIVENCPTLILKTKTFKIKTICKGIYTTESEKALKMLFCHLGGVTLKSSFDYANSFCFPVHCSDASIYTETCQSCFLDPWKSLTAVKMEHF